MKKEEVLELFKEYDAYLEGHFILTSGLHSPHYFQCARVLQHPAAAEKLGSALGEKIESELVGGAGKHPAPEVNPIFGASAAAIVENVFHPAQVPDAVLSPALGGLIIGHEVGRYFNCRAVFAERVEGKMTLKRFDLEPGQKVIVVEDVVTTGGSLAETAALAEELGAEVVAVACLIDRSGGKHTLGRELISLAKVDVVTYEADKLPAKLAKIPAVKPGSRPGLGGKAK